MHIDELAQASVQVLCELGKDGPSSVRSGTMRVWRAGPGGMVTFGGRR